MFQADVLTQIERLYSEFQSHSAERARTHEFPLVPFLKIFSLLLFLLRVISITMFGNHFPFMLPPTTDQSQVSLVESSPNSMTVMVSPKKFRPDIMVSS